MSSSSVENLSGFSGQHSQVKSSGLVVLVKLLDFVLFKLLDFTGHEKGFVKLFGRFHHDYWQSQNWPHFLVF